MYAYPGLGSQESFHAEMQAGYDDLCTEMNRYLSKFDVDDAAPVADDPHDFQADAE